MNAEISETIRAGLLKFGVQIPELLTQRKFVSAECHAHSNAHKPPKTVAPTVLMLEIKILTEVYCSHQYLSIDIPKAAQTCDAHNFHAR